MVVRIVVTLLSWLLVCAVEASAQQHLSILRGTLVDAESRPAAGVPMRIVSEATGQARRFAADDEGRFTILQLEPGTYRIESEDARYAGFIARVAISVNDETMVTLPLAMETISDAVDLRPFFVRAERHVPHIRARLTGDFVANLPLDGRSVYDTVLLAPATSATASGPVSTGTGEGFTGYLLDGFYNAEPLLGRAAIRPQLDAIDTIEVTRASYDASLGRTAGAQVHLVSKSGTNTPSGGAFGFTQTAVDRHQFGAYAGGPAVPNRTFLFGDYQQTRVSELASFQSAGHDLGVRADHVLDGGARLMIRYGLSDGTILGRRAQQFGASVTVPVRAVANDVRFGLTRVVFAPIADLPGIAESQAYQISDTVAWTHGAHVVTGGGEWYAFSRVSSGELAAQVWSGFVQDDWRPSSRLSFSGGLRFGRVSRRDAAVDALTFLAPRAGFAWTFDDAEQMVVRGGYGRAHQPDHAFTTVPRFDQWSLAAERQWGRTRTVELAYLGARGGGVGPRRESSRYNAVMLELEQRSETGLTGYLAYTYGRWWGDLATAGRERGALDARHKWTGAFTWSLPIGDERLLLSKGLLGEILEDMQLSGVFGIQSPRLLPSGTRQRGFKTLDLAVIKNWRIVQATTLQLRFETFNALDRPNPPFALFAMEPFDPFSTPATGRRYQLGARLLF
ncbi:MAG TPA: carboxypeptidase regulatory-like domain-containing protein [Vicinamibacterales bacterium]|nr:carboxypeptidase regulatory-like domain-containing protein [Vicinamibacterales bacterium]